MTSELASGPIQVRVGLHTGAPLLTDEGYVGDDVHFAARVASSSHGGQVILSKRTAELVASRADGPRRASLEGHCRSGPDLPARRRHLPAAEDDLEHEPAACRELFRRPRGGARRSPGLYRGGSAARNPERPRRDGQDSACARGRGDARPVLQGRCLLGRARLPSRSGPRHGDDLPDARRPGRPRRARLQSGRCCSCSTTWSRWSSRPRNSPHFSALVPT